MYLRQLITVHIYIDRNGPTKAFGEEKEAKART